MKVFKRGSDTMEHIRVIMINHNLNIIPFFKIPEGFSSRRFSGSEDNEIWAEIECSVGEFKTEKDALKRFYSEFNEYWSELKNRCFFIEDYKGNAVGTVMAWYNNFMRENYGRLHWVGIKPEYQGKKLGKPLVSLAMEHLKRNHDRAYLTSQTTSYKAINMYLDFGFKPYINNAESIKAWEILSDKLGRPLIDNSSTTI